MIAWFDAHQQGLVGVGGLATVVAAVAAVFALVRAGVESTARTRPYVLAEYRVVPHGYMRLDLVVRNSGMRAARELSVIFDPPFAEEDESGGRLGVYASRRYAGKISVLGPGQEFSNILMYDGDNPDHSDMPEVLKVAITYKGPWWRGGRYREAIELHRTLYTQHIFSESSDSVNGRMKKVVEQLTKITEALDAERKALRLLPQAVAQAAIANAPREDEVSWRIWHVVGDTYWLENAGATSAYGVEMEASEDLHLAGPPLAGVNIESGGIVNFMAATHLGTRDRTLTIQWRDSGDEGAPVRTWLHPLPH